MKLAEAEGNAHLGFVHQPICLDADGLDRVIVNVVVVMPVLMTMSMAVIVIVAVAAVRVGVRGRGSAGLLWAS